MRLAGWRGASHQSPARGWSWARRPPAAPPITRPRPEGMVKKLWPQAGVLRLDSDAARGPDSYFRIWEEFSERRADILVGTQLVTRGLDLPAVTCVGVVDADLPLHFPDYRSAENTFSLVDRKSTRLNSSHVRISYAVFCLKKKKKATSTHTSAALHTLMRSACS